MTQEDYNERRCRHRKRYSHLTKTVEYASACEMNGDTDGEVLALKHAVKLTFGLLAPHMITIKEMEDIEEDALELDGMREMPRSVQDIQEAGAAEEEGTPEAHVVPVVQERDAAPREVLTMEPDPPIDSNKHGLTGDNPKCGKKPAVFKLYQIDAEGNDVKLLDTGTAVEIAGRHECIKPAFIYKHANKPGRPGRAFRVEKVKQ